MLDTCRNVDRRPQLGIPRARVRDKTSSPCGGRFQWRASARAVFAREATCGRSATGTYDKGARVGGPLVSCGATRARRIACGERSRAVGEYSHRKARCVFPGLFPQAEGRKLGEVLHVRPQGCGSGRNSRRGYTPPRGRVRHAESQDGPRRDAQGRRDHGCRRRRSGPDRRGSARAP